MRRNAAKLAKLRALVHGRSQALATSLPSPLPELVNSACSIDISSADHEAIRYFRTTFARVHHTKNPSYSLYAIIFDIAEREPMVMRAVLALGARELEFRLRGSSQGSGRTTLAPLIHYSAALRLLSEAVGSANAHGGVQIDLDTVLSAMYLMLLYELKYGDAKCSGLANHLAGAAQVVRHCCYNVSFEPVTSMPGEKSKHVTLLRRCQSQEKGTRVLSLFAARLLAHMGICDATASSFGLGGQLVAALRETMASQHATTPYEDGMYSLHRLSYSLYRLVWTENYPQAELLDDVENRNIFALLLATSHLKFMVSQLDDTTQHRAHEVVTAIRQVSCHFSEVLGVAEELSVTTNNSHRLVANIRAIVPQFYAVQVEFRRVARRLGLRDQQQSSEHLIEAIMNLALQAFKHQGDEAIIRIAWPMYLVALETRDPAYRKWVLARFQAISPYGENYARAHLFLKRATEQEKTDMFREKESHSGDMELFVL